MAKRMILGFPRWTDKLTFTGGSWESDFPVANLNVFPLAKVSRSADATTVSTQFVATLDKIRSIRLVGVVRHNISLVGQMRIRVYEDTGLTMLLKDTGWFDVWPSVYPQGDLDWEDSSFWDRKYSADEIADVTWTRVVWLGKPYLGRAIKVEVDDTANVDGYVEIGICEVAQGWLAGVNFGYGAQYGFNLRTEVTEAKGGVKYFERRDKPRRFRGLIETLDRDEALARPYEALRQHDIDTPFLWFPFPDEDIHFIRTTYLARWLDPGFFRVVHPGRDAVPFNFEEVL